MCDTSFKQTTIVEMRQQVGTTNMERSLGIYFFGDRVIFRAEFFSPDPSDVSYYSVCAIGVEEYKKGIAQLAQTQRCELHNLCSSEKLVIESDASGGKIKFIAPADGHRTNDLYPTVFQSQWIVAQICLSGMSVECSAEQKVPNIFQGPRWG